MRPEWTLLAGLALGAGGALVAVGRKTPPAPPVSDADALSPARATPAEVVATLGTAPAPSEPTPPAVGSPAADAVVEIDLRDFAEVVKSAPAAEQPQMQVAVMLVRGYAHAGRPAAMRRVILAADAGGVLVEWLSFFGLLPQEQQAAALATYLKDHPTSRPAAGALAWAWVRARDMAQALPPAQEHLTQVRGQDPAMLAALYALDADKADGLAWQLATEKDWQLEEFPAVIGAVCGAARMDLLPRWQQRMQLLQGRAGAGREPTEADRYQAVAAAEQQAREAPEDADRWVEVAQARAEAGDRRGAIAAWRTAIEKAGPDADLLTQFAAFDAAAAFPMIEAAARETQEDDVLLAYVDACLRVGKPDEAGAAFFRMHTLEIDDWLNAGIAGLAPWPALSRLERLLSHHSYRDKEEFLAARADALLALGRGAAAYDAYLKVEAAGGRRALDGLLRADPARAAARFGAMRVETDPDDRLESSYAAALFHTGREAAAKAVAESLLKHWEASKSYSDGELAQLAPVLPERVTAYVRKLIEEDRVDRRCLAAVLLATGRVAEARAEYDACIREGCDDAATLIGRGRCR